MNTLSEHFGYLADTRRAALYEQAIAQTLQKNDTVADLGCGFGIFGLLCLDAGASNVWGIDATDAIDIARETAVNAGFADNYHCIASSTYRTELPGRVDLLICDHVGYFGIDYGIVRLMADARRRFLKPGGRMIPERLDLFLAGIRSDKCRKLLDRWDANTVPAFYAWLRTYAVNTKHAVDFVPTDIATAPVQVGTLALGEDMPETLGFKASLTIDEDGTLDGIGGWFECELGGGVRMTNSPLARDAIRRHQIFLGFDAPMDVAAGDIVEVSVKLNHRNNVVAWNARDPRTGRMLRYSTWASMPMSRSERLKPSLAPRIVNPKAHALTTILSYVDGERSGEEIEQLVLRDHPALLPSSDEITGFVKYVLADYTA